MSELALACSGHPSVFSYSVENESPVQVLGQPLIATLIDAAFAADPSVPLTTEGSGTGPSYNGSTSGGGASAVNLLHYALPDASRTHIRAVGECAWCNEDGMESFTSLAVAGRLNDVAYYAGWDWLNYWSNFFPGFSAARHAWKQRGCEGRDRQDGVDGWGSPLLGWIQTGFGSFFPMDVKAYADNPAFPYQPPKVWPERVDSIPAGEPVNRTIAVFNDVLRGDLSPWDPTASWERTLLWSTHWDDPGNTLLQEGVINVSVAPGFHELVHVAFAAPAPGGAAARRLYIVLRNAPAGNHSAQGELVGVEDKVYISVLPS